MVNYKHNVWFIPDLLGPVSKFQVQGSASLSGCLVDKSCGFCVHHHPSILLANRAAGHELKAAGLKDKTPAGLKKINPD